MKKLFLLWLIFSAAAWAQQSGSPTGGTTTTVAGSGGGGGTVTGTGTPPQAAYFTTPTNISSFSGLNISASVLQSVDLVDSAANTLTLVPWPNSSGSGQPELTVKASSGHANFAVYGAGTAAVFHCYNSNGTYASPTTVTANEVLCGLGAIGYDGTSFPSTQPANFLFRGAETWSVGAHGTFMIMQSVPAGSASAIGRFLIDRTGNVDFGTPAVDGTGAPTGALYSQFDVSGNLIKPEGTAPSGIASSDILWGDSTAHRWKMNNNNAGALNFVGISSAGTSGNCPQFAANGIDIVDSGSATCGGIATGANTALSNLAAVAINAALLPGADNSIALGGASNRWTTFHSLTGTLYGSSSGSTIVQSSATASGTLTLPAATDTLIGKATTDTLTHKTYDTAGTGNSFSINGVAATDNTGTGKVVRDTSPTIVTPTIASFVNATHNHQNAAGGGTLDFTAIGGATILPVANGGTGTAGFSYYINPGYNNVTTTAAAANTLKISGVVLPNPLPAATKIMFQVATADNTNNSDVCLYTKAGALAAHIGAQHLGSTGTITGTIVGGPVSLAAGAYYVGFTSVGSTLVPYTTAGTQTTFYTINNATGISTSGGACPGSITPPADAWLFSSGSTLSFGISP
jgi:hypothetical protein